MPRCLLLPVLLLLLAAPLEGQASSRSYLHDALLDRAPVIVRARLLETRDLTVCRLTRFKVLETLKGPAGPRVTVAGMGERARAYPELEKLLFLEPMSSGLMCRLVDLVDLTEDEGRLRLDLVKRYLRAHRGATNPMALRRRFVRLGLESLESDSSFVRRVGIREVRRWSERAPHLFDYRDLARIRKAGGTLERDADRLQAWRAVQRLRGHFQRPFEGFEEILQDPADRELFLETVKALQQAAPGDQAAVVDKLVEVFGLKARRYLEIQVRALRHEAPAVRCAHHLGRMGEEASVEPLVAALRTGGSARARAVVEALGKVGSTRALPAVRQALRSQELMDAAITALGRIGGPEAETLLSHLQQRLRKDPEGGGRIARIREVMSPEFRKAELERRRRARSTLVRQRP